MKIRYIYFWVFLAVVILCFGFAFPYLFSSNTDLGLIAGYVLLAMFIWYVIWNVTMIIGWIVRWLNYINSK